MKLRIIYYTVTAFLIALVIWGAVTNRNRIQKEHLRVYIEGYKQGNAFYSKRTLDSLNTLLEK